MLSLPSTFLHSLGPNCRLSVAHVICQTTLSSSWQLNGAQVALLFGDLGNMRGEHNTGCIS